MDQKKWDILFAQVFADFPDERVVQEAKTVLEAMGYAVQQNGSYYFIPRDVPLAIVHRSLHSDGRLRSGGFLTFEVAVGPHFTAQGEFNGVCEYGLLRLKFGLDGTFQDDFFTISPVPASPEVEWEYERTPAIMYTLAEKQARYEKKSERGSL
ncbi:MAG: hypothetical protein KAX24_13645 [Anaerolineae bacterium]|nr:hypothetical protein [Anaerolineae bacterium]